MAKVKLNSVLEELKGTLAGWTFKKTAYGTTITPKPEKPQIWSEAQKANRTRLQQDAALFYRAEMSDPVKETHYRARARALKIPVSAFVMGGFMKHGPQFSLMETPVMPENPDAAGRDGGDGD